MSSQKRKREDIDGGETFHPSDEEDTRLWTYKLYRGPNGQKVRVKYCSTLQECETAMRRIANSSVLGFDLEWKPFNGPNIKDMVSVIQLASESDIIIVHIAAFPGGREMTPRQLLSPSLKRILEDQSIIKVGLKISGDGNRMRDHLGVYMKGVVEVSRLRPDDSSLKNPSLSAMTKAFFGMPLDKKLSTSTWHRERRLRQDEIEYAGTDAYAGLKLFQHFIGDRAPSGLIYLDFRALEKKKRQFDPSSLLEKLKKLRLQLTADPQATIMDVGDNLALEAIAKHCPTTLSALNEVPRFRSTTLLKYKKAIIELVQDHMNTPPQDDTAIVESSPEPSQGTLEIAGTANCLAGLTFVITGVLPNLSRDNAQKVIEQFGGKVTTSPSRKTNYVVLGNDAGRKKLEMIGKLRLETVDEEELLDMIRTRQSPADTEHEGNRPSRAKKRARKDSKAGTRRSTAPSSLTSPQDSPSSQDLTSSSQIYDDSSHDSSASQTLGSSSQVPSPSQDTNISISSSQDSSSQASTSSQASDISSATTNIYNTLDSLRQNLSQRFRRPAEELATDDLLRNLAEVRPLSRVALKNLGAGGFAEMVLVYEGEDVVKICRRG